MKIIRTANYKKAQLFDSPSELNKPEPVEDLYSNNQPNIYVSIYEVDRGYGGPEEGGWGYDHFTYTGESYPFETEEEAKLKARELNSQFRANKEKKTAKVEQYQGENETQSKPLYE